MPLPVNTTLSLQGHTRPGEGITSKPKRAMIVRLSEATLDALQKLSAGERMGFEFGDTLGIHIQDAFFPMSMATPITNHELFIRTNIPKRPSGPLKLNANVVARLNVDTSDDRDLSRVRKQLQESKSAAEKEKTERKIVVLPVPPPVVKPTASRSAPKLQKKKQPTKAAIVRAGPSRGISPFPGASITQPVIQSVPAPSPQPSTSAAAIAVDAIANAPTIDDLTSLRGQLVHFLALGSQSGKDLAAELRGDMDKETFTEQLLSALNELAEKDMLPKNSNGATVTWRLKPSSWLAVRPHTYPLYNDSQRLTAERNARTFVSRLGIKEGDPQWEHVKFRGSGGGGSAAVATSTAKRAGKSKVAATEIKAKSEAVMPSTSHRGKVNTDSSTSARPPPMSTPKPSQLNSITSSRNPPPPVSAPILPEREQRERERAKRDLDPEREEGEISASATPPREPPAKSSIAPVNRRLPGSRLGSAAPHSSGSATNGINRNGVGGASTSLVTSRDREVYAQSDRESERERPLAVTTKKDSAVAAAKKQDRPPSALSNSSVKQERAPSVLQSVKPEKVERDRERDRAPGGSKHVESDRERDRDRERGREKERDRERELRMREAAVREREREKERGREQERARPPKGTKRKQPTWTDDDSDENDRASVSVSHAARKTARGETSVSEMTKKKARASEAVAASGSGRNASNASVANGKLREDVDRERVRERDHVKRDRRDRSRERGRDRDENERERDRNRDRDRVRERDRDRAERDQDLYDRDRRHRAGSPVRKMIKREEPPSPASHKRMDSTSNVPKVNGTSSSSGKAIERQSATTTKREVKPSATKEGGSSRALERERERDRDREPPKRKERLGSEARKRLAEYTSTEDEDDLPPPKATKKSSGATVTTVRSRAHAPASSATATSPSASSSATSLPSDSASLRSLYSATYAKFMKVFQELVSQKAKVKGLLGRGKIPNGLSNGRHGNGSSDSGDEDLELSDADIMGFEELERLVKEHNRLREELDSIKSAFVG